VYERALGTRTHGKLGPQTLSYPDPIGYHQSKVGWWPTYIKKGEGGTMNRKSSAFGLLWTEGKQDTLAKDGIRALLLGLLVITLAVVAMVAVMPLADYEVSPGITAGFEAGLARWGVVAKLCAADNEGSSRSSSAKAYSPDEAFVRSVAVMGPSADGYVAAGPCTATSCTLSISPAEAYAQSLAQTDGSGAAQAVAPHEAFVRSVAVTGQNWAGYMAAGPCSAPFGTLSMGPAEAYAWGLAQTDGSGAAQAVPADEAFVRSVAVTGQSWAG
jgi:hypothetical protein